MFQLYKAYSVNMLNIAYRILNNREDAEDILQDSFAEAFMKIKNFRFESTFGQWLKRIVINKCLNLISKRKVDLKLDDDMEKFDKQEDKDLSNENITFKIEKIRNALEKLPNGFRLVFSLYAFEGYNHKEIAGILNISESTSKTQYLRAKNKMVQLIKQES